MKKTNNNNGWKIKQAEWRGYVAKSLEDQDEKMERIEKKVDKLDERMIGLQLKMAGIGAVSAVLITLILNIVGV